MYQKCTDSDIFETIEIFEFKSKYVPDLNNVTEDEAYHARAADNNIKHWIKQDRFINAYTDLVFEAYTDTKPDSIEACRRVRDGLLEEAQQPADPAFDRALKAVFEFRGHTPAEIEAIGATNKEWALTNPAIMEALQAHQGEHQELSELLQNRNTRNESLTRCGATNTSYRKVNGKRVWVGIKIKPQGMEADQAAADN